MTKIDYNKVKQYKGLSADEKPVENVHDGSTFYCFDTKKQYIFYNGIWYEKGSQNEN